LTDTIRTANKISYFRKKLGLTQNDLSEKIFQETGRKFRQATVSAWEKGHSTPAMKIMQALAKILYVQVDDLYEKSVLNEEGIIYHQDIKAFEKALKKAETTFKKDPEAGFDLLREQFTLLIGKLGELSDSNTKMKEKFNKISEMMRNS